VRQILLLRKHKTSHSHRSHFTSREGKTELLPHIAWNCVQSDPSFGSGGAHCGADTTEPQREVQDEASETIPRGADATDAGGVVNNCGKLSAKVINESGIDTLSIISVAPFATAENPPTLP
jgi:hypothetical protein